MGTFSDAVRAMPDGALVALLRARPDLAAPSPSTLRSLAARASSRTSLDRALAQADTPTLQVLEAVLALEALQPEVTADDVAAAVGATEPDDVAAVSGLVDHAVAQVLLWTPPMPDGQPAPRPPLRTAPGLAEVLVPGLVPGTASTPTPVPPPSHQSVTPITLQPPVPNRARTVAGPVADGEAAAAAVEAVRLVDTLIHAWQDAPPPVLRSGGLGVRDLRRTAQALEVDEATAASVVELAATAGLVDDDGDDPPSYVPTTRADDWDEAGTAERWGMLAAAWAGSRRMPWLAGTRDEKGAVRAPLSSELGRGWVPRLRTLVLTSLDALGPVAARTGDVVGDLAWRTPRAVPPEATVAGLLREAALLGATGAGSLAATGRMLLTLLRGDDEAALAAGTATAGHRDAGGNGGSGAAPAVPLGRGAHALTPVEAALAGALRGILPTAVDELLLQGDLTGVVPGRPSYELALLVERATEVESRGAATTVRFTPASVTRALDGGATADDLLEQLSRLSRTPVPQALEYLVRDTERRHAALRVGAAGSYVRAADPAVLTGLVEDERLADLGLIRLAPTVVAASVPAAALQAALRQRGLLAALEGPDGKPLGRLRRPARIERGGARALRPPYATAGAPSSDAERRALVERLRLADGEGRRSPFASTAGGEAGVSVAALARSTPAVAGSATGSGAPAASSGTAAKATDTHTPARPGSPAGTGSHILDRLRAEAGTPALGDALALLRDAVREGGHVWVELVDGHGRPVRRRVRPLKVEAGRLRALDPERGAELTVAIHRIAAVDPDDT